MAADPGSRNAGGGKAGEDRRLEAALKQAQESPGDDALWNEAEALAAELQRTDDVASAYAKVLKGKPSRSIAGKVAQRAIRLHEEWLGADPDALIEILERALALDPGLDWAFERLTLILSVGQRWEDLLKLYDSAIAAVPDGARRRALLLEAAGVAKDFLGHIDRAIGYLEQLFRAKPADAQVASSLERLLERQGAWDGLAKVWETRLGLIAGAEARELRERLATLYLDKLGDPDRALAEARRLIDGGDDAVPTALLERILATASAAPALRGRALSLLRGQHERMGREDRIVAALRVAVEFVPDEEKTGLLRETAERLSRQGDTRGAMEQIVDLLALTPEDAALRARLAHLAGLSGAHETLVRGLLAAAQATTDGRLRVALLLEAAQVHEELLGRPAEAVALYKRVVDDGAAETGRKLAVLRRLVDLLGDPAQAGERLAALERMAELERGPGARRAALGESARLAAGLGDTERAAGAWRKRLSLDPTDREALDSLVDLAAAGARAELLVEALRARAGAGVTEAQRRADLTRIAEIQAEQLNDPAGAVETWRQIEARFGEDPTTVAALRRLLAAAERWKELIERLSRAGEADRTRLAELCEFLGAVCLRHTDDTMTAAAWFTRSLRADPGHEPARAGLRALLGRDDKSRAAAVAALVRAYGETDDWAGLLEVFEARLAGAGDPAARARLCAEAVEIAEHRVNDAPSALRYAALTLAHAPDDGRALSELLRLAEKTGGWTAAAEAVEAAIARLPEGGTGERAAHLGTTLGQLRDTRLHDPEKALGAYEAALRAAPERLVAKAAVVRLAAGLGRWSVAVEATLAAPAAPEVIERELLPLLEKAAAAPENARALGEAMSAAIARRPTLPRTLVRDLETRVAGWVVAGAEPDQAAQGAERALLRAVSHDSTNVPTLEKLMEVQRSRPGRPLFDTLMKLGALAPSLDPLIQAADLAKSLGDEEMSRNAYRQLLDRSVQILRSGGKKTSAKAAQSAAVRAVEGLAVLLAASADRAEARQAVDLLMDTARLPIPVEAARSLLRRAARIAADDAADQVLAREIYRRLADEDPTDEESARELARLYEAAEQFSDLLALRRRQLGAGSGEERREERLAARLELARIGGLIEVQVARVQTLLANLEELPGHAPTVAALAELLRSHGRDAELCDVLTAQARKLEDRGEGEAAGRLWAEVAGLAEKPLNDVPRAIAAHERVAALLPASPTLDALARLYLSCNEPATAAGWLEQRLAATSSGPDRMAVSNLLAQAYVAAGQRHRAVACLERLLQEQPRADSVRVTLVELYRAAEAWESLAGALGDRALNSEDKEVVLACAREATALYREKLNLPERAVPVLGRALAVQPGERALRTVLADCLRAAKRPAEARAALQPLLEEVGRRRSRERAALHHQIALCARDEGDLKLAIEHLDQAAAMVLDSMPVQLALAEVAEEAGDLARAEQAYRALLVLARRGDPGEAPLAASEVLLRLERLAKARGQAQAAAECFDSAVAMAMQNPAEARRLQAALLARGEGEAALALLEKRRAAAVNPVEEARVACELGMVLASRWREEEGLELLLKALEKVPENAEAHAAARALAKKQKQSARYLEMLLGALDQRRRWDDGPRVAELLLRAGDVAEQDVGDPRAAAAHYARAEQTGSRVPEALAGLARVSALLGDTAEEAGALDRLQRLAAQAPTPQAAADILYRLAERQLAGEQTRSAGLASLAAALDRAPDFTRALALVRGAAIPDQELPRVMPLYEKVARASGNDRMLLDFLERRAATPQAQQAEVREGVELAMALGERKRVEALLERAVALGQQKKGGLREASWAIVELAERRRAAGDLDGAARLLEEGREASGSPRVLSGLRDIAREAARQNKTALAARILERLRDAYPADRDVWQPLLELYAHLGDRPSMERLVAETTAKLLDRAERNLVRMAWARFLLESGETGDGVSSVLRDVIMDEPGQAEAVLLLAELHEKRGDVGEAVALLSEALRETDAHADDARRAALARRLAELVSRADPAQAKQVYRTALEAPFADPALKRSLQASLLELLRGDDEVEERAALTEEILGGESGETAARLALDLMELRKRLNDERAARRALELGRARAPESRALFERLDAYYQEGSRWRELVELLADEAPRVSARDRAEAAALWRRAASVRRDRLSDQMGAMALLRQAVASSPGDPDLLRELASCLLGVDQWDSAVEEVTRGLGTPDLPAAARVGLLRLRAELRSSAGDDDQAVADLEDAFNLGPDEVADELTDALGRSIARFARENQVQAERAATFRLSQIFTARADHERAQQLLWSWVERHPDDHEALRVLRQRFEASQNWDEAAQVCARLLAVESGEARIDAALALADACEKLGRPADAVPALEQVLSEVPGHHGMLTRLVRLYEQAGDGRRAGALMIEIGDHEPDDDKRFAALMTAANILLRENDPAEAFTALEKAVQIRPKDREARRMLADASLAAGLYQEAAETLGTLLSESRGVSPNEMSVLYHRLGRAAAGVGDQGGQLQALKRALDADRKNGDVASELADLAEQVGDDDLALRALRAVTLHAQNGPLSPAMAFYRQARIVHRQGDRPRALIFTKRALQEDPGLSAAKEFLTELG
jgi:tetratricopeptide (TPR) repeat protein